MAKANANHENVQAKQVSSESVDIPYHHPVYHSVLITKPTHIQMKEMNEKQDRADADKKKAADDDWAFTVSSRNAQLKAKADRAEADRLLEEKLNIAWREKMDAVHEKEEAKAKALKASTLQIKSLQYAEGVANARKKVEDKIIQIEQDRLLREIASQDDAKYCETVNEQIRKYQAEGKPVYTLVKALDYRQPELIPAVLIKGKRTEH